MKEITIQKAYDLYKEGKEVIISSDKNKFSRNTADVRRYKDKAIPEGEKFMSYVWNYQFWTNEYPKFYIAD